ncbi:helix-turn-helix domain-containing protein [Psychroserpens ponticola]|uniref:Helix-turn-helix transcriptional regulator n=1 Tax=Psychroserpens ponticola TaxID=2932268 RepID=A0ABY7S1J5_9FLAO|nr:helix-turn-helix transcriptional regulator [Psychroserpens ponticola]WCO03269.1 helix-turn-helix transcriptional regulator [Psychroserpens ponticola]
MINTEDFTKRLQKVIDYYGESASSFAEKIGVQRSSISHILSGRNKPSLDFVLKVLSSFPEVELYWLMNGKGEFPSGRKIESHSANHNSESNSRSEISEIVNSKDKTIERIVIFYKDGSFQNFDNS